MKNYFEYIIYNMPPQNIYIYMYTARFIIIIILARQQVFWRMYTYIYIYAKDMEIEGRVKCVRKRECVILFDFFYLIFLLPKNGIYIQYIKKNAPRQLARVTGANSLHAREPGRDRPPRSYNIRLLDERARARSHYTYYYNVHLPLPKRSH